MKLLGQGLPYRQTDRHTDRRDRTYYHATFMGGNYNDNHHHHHHHDDTVLQLPAPMLQNTALCKGYPIFQHRVWYCMISLRYACIQSSGIILTPLATVAPNFVFRGLHCWAKLAHGEKSRTQSLSVTQLIWCARNWSKRILFVNKTKTLWYIYTTLHVNSGNFKQVHSSWQARNKTNKLCKTETITFKCFNVRHRKCRRIWRNTMAAFVAIGNSCQCVNFVGLKLQCKSSVYDLHKWIT